jgi:hypothetical protein
VAEDEDAWKKKRRKDSYTYKIISCFINGEKSYGTNI